MGSKQESNRELLERLQIREVAEAYFNALDRLDKAALAACFTEGAETIYHKGSPKERATRGRQTIVEELWKTRATHEKQNFTLSTMVVQLAGERAESTTFAIIQHLMQGKVSVAGMRYDDVFLKQDGRWLIDKRRHERLWEYVVDAVQ